MSYNILFSKIRHSNVQSGGSEKPFLSNGGGERGCATRHYTSVSFVIGQFPPVFFICFIISFLWLCNFLHRNSKWSVVCCSSHRHIGLTVLPNLWRYDLSFPCPVSIVVNSRNIGIFCSSPLLIYGKKALVTAPFPLFVYCRRHIWSPFSFSHITTTSLGILYTTGPSSTPASFVSLSTNSFPSLSVSFYPAEMHKPL